MSRPPVCDRAGAPMIWVDAIGAYIHWLPVSKLQFEYFLCDQPGTRFDQKWYNEILKLNARIPPAGVQRANYWQALLTGIRPDEANAFVEWNNEAYDGVYALFTRDLWFQAYQALRSEPPLAVNHFNDLPLQPRMKTLVERFSAVTQSLPATAGAMTRADQMLMRQGVLEWVSCQGDRRGEWGGFGQPNRDFFSLLYSPDRGDPYFPARFEEGRLMQFGFRLLRRDT
jgi:hypothetical protein